MAKFLIRDYLLQIPNHALNDGMRKLLESGYYEGGEARAIDLHLCEEDRVLELGAGAGYISMRIASRVGGANLMTVEANPQMVPVVEKNLATNLIEDVTVINAAVVGDNFEGESIDFHVTAAFWSSSINPARTKKWDATKTIKVPTVKFSELMQEHRPTAVVMDIEGGEQGLFEAPWPDHIRLLLIELHPTLYPDHCIKQIFDTMSASGLTYCPRGSRDTIVVFKRVGDTSMPSKSDFGAQ
ncbi:FkbM family methyltransferase [Profundibacter sp.]